MNKVISIALTAVLLLPILSKVWIFIDFKINQDFIAEFLCINKDEPILLCSGTCYFNEQLKEAEEKEQSPQSSVEKPKVLYGILHFFELTEQSLPLQKNATLGYQAPSYTSSYIDEVFHPPS